MSNMNNECKGSEFVMSGEVRLPEVLYIGAALDSIFLKSQHLLCCVYSLSPGRNYGLELDEPQEEKLP